MWGTFRDSSGPIGLLTWGQLEKTPVKVELATRNGDAVVKIASGADHLALLTRDGDIWTLGNQGRDTMVSVFIMTTHCR